MNKKLILYGIIILLCISSFVSAFKYNNKTCSSDPADYIVLNGSNYFTAQFDYDVPDQTHAAGDKFIIFIENYFWNMENNNQPQIEVRGTSQIALTFANADAIEATGRWGYRDGGSSLDSGYASLNNSYYNLSIGMDMNSYEENYSWNDDEQLNKAYRNQQTVDLIRFTIGSGFVKWDNLAMWDCTGIDENCSCPSASDSTPPIYSNLNFTSGTNAHNQTIWQTDQLTPAVTSDSTPSLTLTLDDANSRCAISTLDYDYPDMIADESTTNCTNTSSTEWSCTLPSAKILSDGQTCVYVSCNNSEGYGNKTTGCLYVESDTFAPNVSLDFPTDNSANATLNFLFRGTIWEALGQISNMTLYTNESGTWTNVSTNETCALNTTCDLSHSFSSEGNYAWNFEVCDDRGNCQFNETANFTLILDTTDPSVSDISWATTLGFTSSNLLLLQSIQEFNATATDIRLDSVFIEVIKPNGNIALNNASMSNVSGSNFNWTGNLTVDLAGTWTIYVYANDSVGNVGETSSSFTVSTQTLSSIDNWYGFGNGTILEADEIINLSNDYSYNIFEFEQGIMGLFENWTTLLTAINNSKESNVKVGLNLILDYDYRNGVQENEALDNFSNFSELILPPYTDTLEYISFEPINLSDYDDADIYNTINNLSSNATVEVSNEFVMFTKNYNSTGLDDSYITGIPFVFINENKDITTETALVDAEAYNYRYNSSETRFYISITPVLQTIAEWFYNNIFNPLRGLIDIQSTIESKIVAEVNSVVHDVIIFNNQSTTQEFNVNISNVSGFSSSYDVWDATNGILIENNTDGNISVNVSGYSAVMLFLDSFDHIQLNTLSTGILYKASAESSGNFSYGGASAGGNWGLYGAHDIKIEVFDPTYVYDNSFITYYGWVNSSYVTNWSQYDIIIFDDEKTWAVSNLTDGNTNSELYCYISVADYDKNDQEGWLATKKLEVDNCLALNSSFNKLNPFFDGFDYTVDDTNFTVVVKKLIDYSEIDLNVSVGLNTYTAYQDFCVWSKPDGFCMKESAVRRWNGSSSDDPDAYDWEDWDLELNKSRFFQANDVTIVAQSFQNRTFFDQTFFIKNLTLQQDLFFATKVLGYEYFYSSQPDFNYAYTVPHPDLGNDLSNGYSTDDDETYYRQYANGVVYYNSSNHDGWFDDGMTTESVNICAYLTDANDAGGFEDDNLQMTVMSDSVGECWGAGTCDVPPDFNQNNYLFTAEEVVAGSNWYCKEINSSDYSETGTYHVYFQMENRGQSADSIHVNWNINKNSGIHSFYDLDAVNPFDWYAYAQDQNWMVTVFVNKTQKASVDTTSNITQTEASDTRKNITLSSDVDMNIEVWAYPFKITGFSWHNLSYYNGSDYILLNPTNTTDCDSNNPTFASDTINGESHKSCYEENSTHTIFRVATPHLSDQIYQLDTDFTNPEISFVDITTNSSTFNGQNFIEVNISASDQYLDWINFTIWNLTDNTKIYSNNGTSSFFTNVTDLVFDSYYLNATAYDQSNNSNTTETRSIILTNVILSIDFIDPTTDSSNTTHNFIEVSLNVTNTTEIDNLNLTLWDEDTDTKLQSVNNSSDLLSYNFTSLSDGNYSFNATVNDTSGTSASSSTRYVSIDDTSPVSVYADPTTNDSNSTQNWIFINISVTEEHIDMINLTLWNESTKLYSNNTSLSSLVVNFTGLQLPGNYSFNATINDTFGLSDNLELRDVNLDNINPSVDAISPIDGYTQTGGSIDFNFNNSENWFSTVDCSLLINGNPVKTESVSDGNNSISYNVDTGTQVWAIQCTDPSGNSNITSNRTLIIVGDSGSPVGGGSVTPAEEEELGPSSKGCFEQDQDFFSFLILNGERKNDSTKIRNICDFDITANVNCYGNICDILEYSNRIEILANSSIEYDFSLFLPMNYDTTEYYADLRYDNQTIEIKLITKDSFFEEIKNDLKEEIEIKSPIPGKGILGKITAYKLYLIVYFSGIVLIFLFLLLFKIIPYRYKFLISFTLMTLIMLFWIIKNVIW